MRTNSRAFSVLRLRRDECDRSAARADLARLGDRIFQVEDQHVGGVAHRLRELALAVGRHEEHGSQLHCGLPQHQRLARAGADFLVALVEALVQEGHDAGVGPRLAGAQPP
jgi:hypothetical protein